MNKCVYQQLPDVTRTVPRPRLYGGLVLSGREYLKGDVCPHLTTLLSFFIFVCPIKV